MMKLLKRLFAHFRKDEYPDCLKINGRSKLPTTAFKPTDKLYHAYNNEDLDENDDIKLETVRFPDFSCNWNRFSEPIHVRYRKNGLKTDGCYSFTVEIARYKSIATPVHDPDPDEDNSYPNYSHVEIRQLLVGETVHFEPPKKRYSRSKKQKSTRLEYRQNLLSKINYELPPE
ncbi:MAG TPA: hypothetical protein ENI15_04695 [Spirochaetes bacterium]|nr:hypothetical protein [Spirochaetota bacterium]